MESDTVIPAKRQRSGSASKPSPNLKVSECIREFKLPQAYPSMAKYQKMNKNMTVRKITLPTPLSSSIASQQNNGSSNDMKLPNKLQKLKLKSPDGRSLGEFDVQILPRVNNNHVENRTISLSMNKTSQVNETILHMKPDPDRPNSGTSKLKLSPAGVIDGVNTSKLSINYRSKSNSSFISEGQLKSAHGVLIPIAPNLMANSNGKLQQSQITNDNSNDNKMYVVQSGNNWRVVKFSDKEKTDIQKITSPPTKVESSDNKRIEVDVAQSESPYKSDMKNFVLKKSSMFKAVQKQTLKAVKLIDNGNNQFRQSAVGRTEDVGAVKICGTKRSSDISLMRPFIKEKKLASSMDPDSRVMNVENVNDNNDPNSGNNDILPLSCNGNDSSHYDKTNSAGNSAANSRQSYPLRNSHGTVNLIRRGRKDSNTIAKLAINADSTNTNDVSITSAEKSTHSTTSPNTTNNLDTLSNDDMSSRLSIVGKALSMISDDELRTKALQALADCGIGIERLVPVQPPLSTMSIKESQTQTSVFGLLDSNDFVRVTGDTDSLSRLQEIERHIIVDDTNIPKIPNRKTQTFVQELSKILEQRWVNKVNVAQVKKILKIDPLVEKACTLMEIDFKNVKKYDKNGLLSIHRAIISDQPRAVKRQLMVLRSCKHNIDVPTSTGETGLELGIKNSVSPEIVNLLLKSGASPTAREPAHDSALTIAANESSHFLPQLIKYVLKSGDLNNVDSEGFTALHYCVRNDNIDGILALISANADLNVRDLKSGRTPLFHAVENDYLLIAKELLANGAKANIPNFSGQTVFALFDEEKHFSLRDALNKSVK